MNVSLRMRFLASYLVLLSITMAVIVVALLLFLSTREEPDAATLERLTTIARTMEANVTVRNALALRDVDTPLLETLGELGTLAEVRVMAIRPFEETVIFDSFGTYESGAMINVEQVIVVSPASVGATTGAAVQRRPTLVNGSFVDADNEKWLFAGVQFDGGMLRRAGLMLLLADTKVRSLQESLTAFGSALLIPVIQAGLVGLVVAALLAVFISRTIVRPLQVFAAAAEAVAGGDYTHTVAVSGAPEFRAVAEAFNTMTTEMNNTQNAQRDFMANVSHDLKTPLTSIQGYSQAIMDGTARNPAHAAEIIYDEAGRLARMVSDLTELARLQADALHMKKATIDVGQITEAIINRLQVVAIKKGVTLDTDVRAVPNIVGDGDRLAQVITNLLSNAIKFTPSGGCVWVRVSGQRGGVEINIRDSGIGIPPQELSRIFERFYQVDKARGPERGTGLGLAISREIIQAHGGEIRAASGGAGKGTSFSVWLPLAA